MMRMSREEFEKVVARALDALPAEVAPYLDNVAVVVEEAPSEEDLLDAGLDPATETLFGLYHGVALPARESYANVLPDRIAIYRQPLLAECGDRAELVREIQDTVIHEIGHFFGMDEEDLP
ncbi:MAG: metallopeptidase family protein [Acidobacteriota bacterium]